MEPVGADHPLHRCVEDAGVPKKLMGEGDLFSLNTTDQLEVELQGPFDWNGQILNGNRASLTTHRLYWQTAEDKVWYAIRLDMLTGADLWKRMLRTTRLRLNLDAGKTVCIKVNEAESLLKHVQDAVKAEGWRKGSYEAPALGGLQKLLVRQEASAKGAREELDLARTDLSALKDRAMQVVGSIRKMAAVMSSSDDPSKQTAMDELFADFGLLDAQGRPVAKGGTSRADIEADVARVCEAALGKRKGLGILPAHDVFCLVNRARGTQLVAPGELMKALQSCSKPGGPLRLKPIAGGVNGVSLATTSDAEIDARLVDITMSGPLSAFGLAEQLGLTAMEADYLLRDAEERAVLVRDDAPEGVYYYKNFFVDY